MMKNNNVTIRLATLEDMESIEVVMKRSMKVLGEGHYSEQQIDACCRFVCVPDRQLIEDQTFFVAVTDEGIIVGCGGWSFREKLHAGPKDTSENSAMLDPSKDRARIRAMFVDPLYSGKGIGAKILEQSEKAAKAYGFSKGTLGATLSGLAFYKAKGWKSVAEERTTLPNEVIISVITMEKDFS